jgi:hypothetical protein
MSAKLVPTFADRGCRVVSATDPHGGYIIYLYKNKLRLYVKYRSHLRILTTAILVLLVVVNRKVQRQEGL